VFLCPQILLFVRRLAACVIIDDAVDHFPMAIVTGRNPPAGQVAAIEKRDAAGGCRGCFRQRFGGNGGAAEGGEKQERGEKCFHRKEGHLGWRTDGAEKSWH